MGSPPAFTEAWRLFSRYALVSVPLLLERDAAGKKTLKPLSQFKHLWDAPPRDEVVEELWDGKRDASGLAMLVTRRAGLFGLDTDAPEATDWAFGLLKRTRTPTIRSARGFKWLFQLDGLNLSSSQSEVHANVDVKAPNSLIIIPPTPGYEWQPSLSIDDVPTAEPPASLRSLLKPKRVQAAAPITGKLPDGGRHRPLVSLAGTMRRRGMSTEAILAALRVVNAEHCDPPLEDEWVAKIAASSTWEPDEPLPLEQPPTPSGASIPLAKVHAGFQRGLYLPDTGALDISLAAAVAHKRGIGEPLWPGLVGGPGNTKTEIIRAFDHVEGIYPLSELTAQTFASGLKGTKDASLLNRLRRDNKSFLTLKDFTTVLSMRHEDRAKVLAQLRELYDGSYKKDFGTGESVSWEGRLGLLFGVTGAIDSAYSVDAQLGQRFVLFRVPEGDRRKTVLKARLGREERARLREELQALVSTFVASLDVSRPVAVGDEFDAISDFVTRARTAVIRDGYSREIVARPLLELPTRFVQQLVALYEGLTIIGLDHLAAVALTRKIADDSIPPPRLAVLRVLRDGGGRMKTGEIIDDVGLPGKTASRVLEDLTALDMARRIGRDSAESDDHRSNQWEITEEALSVWALADSKTSPEKYGG